MILVIDNYDSFVENLARYIRLAQHETRIFRNDEITLQDIKTMNPDGIVISPGPCTPHEAGICLDLITHMMDKIPILGICLGHQAIVQACDGTVMKGPPCHGQQSIITHDGLYLFEGVSSPTNVGRYHSLICDIGNSPDLIECASTQDGINMAVRHKEHHLYGLQFHPESILTDDGMRYIQNFLKVVEYDRC